MNLTDRAVLVTGANRGLGRAIVNYLGALRVIRAFAPVLAGNGGGIVVNVLSMTPT